MARRTVSGSRAAVVVASPSSCLLIGLLALALGARTTQAFVAPSLPSAAHGSLRPSRAAAALARPARAPAPLGAAASDDSGSGGPRGESEEARRKRIMALQREVAEDILAASPAEREAAEAKKREQRMATRRKVYEAYSKVGGEVSISQIGIPKKMTRMSKSSYADEKKVVSRGRPYAERKFQLQFDSVWLSTLGLAATWALTSFEASVSYGLGALLGLGYVTLLARSVEAIGTGGPGAGVGQARFGMVILLVLFAGKYRDTIQLIPALVGFSMYQVASFLQAFDREEPPPEGAGPVGAEQDG